jgi:uncharacterized RDD family membrane protein YckC
MTTADTYIGQLLDALPPATPRREQIALELRAHIAERMAHGDNIDAVLRALGDPVRLAESYLTAVPLASAPHRRRLLAKIIDVLSLVLVLAPPAAYLIFFQPVEIFPLLVALIMVVGSILFGVYLVVAESRLGYTLGKSLMGLRVVRESGARISIGQSIVRQLPMFLQVYWIDVLFALFTDKRQRAFELLSKTRVVEDFEARAER